MLLELEPTSSIPLYQQIRDQVVLGLARQELTYGEALPSVRQLADDLGINMMTVSKAYTLLKGEGYLETDRRQGTKIVSAAPTADAFNQAFLAQLTLLLAEAKVHQLDLRTIQHEITTIYHDFEGGQS